MREIEIITRRKKKYVIFKFPYKKDDKEFDEMKNNIKKIPGRNFNWDEYYWEVGLNLTSAKYVNAYCKHYKFKIAPEFTEYYTKINKKSKINEKLSKAEEISNFKIEGLKLELRPFQQAGVAYALRNKKILLGDEQGLGKTPQAIAVFHYLNTYPVLIMTPNSLKWNWYYEIQKWTEINKDDISIIEASDKNKRFDKKIIIINYDIIAKYKDELKKSKFKVFICDESHYLKNSKTKRGKAAFSLSRQIPYKLLLTGTPISNRPVELVHQLYILDILKEFGGAWNFKMQYCDGKEGYYGWDFSGASNLDELHAKMRQIGYVRRNKKDVLKELPDKIESIVYLDLSNRKKYDKAQQEFIEFLKDDYNKNPNNYKTDIMKVVAEKLSELEIEEKAKYEHFIKAAYLRKIIAEGKIKNIINWIETFLESGEKLVVFAFHRFLVEAIADHFKCKKIYGGIKPKERQDNINDFQNNPNTKLLILNIASGKEGITLTAASNMAIVELTYVPSDILQCKDRIHRIGQKEVANIYYLMGKDTHDLIMLDVLEQKMKIINKVNAGIDSDDINCNSSVYNDIIKKLIK